MGLLQLMQTTGPRLARLGTRALLLLPMAAEEGQQHLGGASDLTRADAHHPGPFVGRLADHGDVVELGPGPGDALAVGAPAAPAGHLGKADTQAEGYAVAGEGEDLVADHGVRDPPLAPGGIGAVLDRQGDADREGAGVSRVGGRERHPGGVGAGQGTPGERLDDQAAGVDDSCLDPPGEEGTVEGAAVAFVSDVEGAGELANMDHATAPPGWGWSSMPATGARSS